MIGLYIIGFVVIVAAIYVIAEIWKETHEFKVVNYQIQSKKLRKQSRPLKVVFLSDLHNHEYGEKNKLLLEAIRNGKPDYILIGGDMLIGRKKHYDFQEALEFVKQLPQIAPVYYANGNHEERMHLLPEYYGESYVEYKSALEASGINWLENDSVILPWEQEKVRVYGVELPLECYMRKEKHYLEEAELVEQIGTADASNFNLLMAHHPSFAPVYEKWGADLTVSGHMHGGIARLPILGGVLSPQFGIFPKYSGGFYEVGASKIVVSKGLGTHTVHIRFWNPAELIFLEINGER